MTIARCARRRREWAHDRESYVGKLGKDWNDAVAKGWAVVNMKDDWNTIFPPAINNHSLTTK